MGELQNIGNYSEIFEYLQEQVIYFEENLRNTIFDHGFLCVKNNNISGRNMLCCSIPESGTGLNSALYGFMKSDTARIHIRGTVFNNTIFCASDKNSPRTGMGTCLFPEKSGCRKSIQFHISDITFRIGGFYGKTASGKYRNGNIVLFRGSTVTGKYIQFFRIPVIII